MELYSTRIFLVYLCVWSYRVARARWKFSLDHYNKLRSYKFKRGYYYRSHLLDPVWSGVCILSSPYGSYNKRLSIYVKLSFVAGFAEKARKIYLSSFSLFVCQLNFWISQNICVMYGRRTISVSAGLRNARRDCQVSVSNSRVNNVSVCSPGCFICQYVRFCSQRCINEFLTTRNMYFVFYSNDIRILYTS